MKPIMRKITITMRPMEITWDVREDKAFFDLYSQRLWAMIGGDDDEEAE